MTKFSIDGNNFVQSEIRVSLSHGSRHFETLHGNSSHYGSQLAALLEVICCTGILFAASVGVLPAAQEVLAEVAAASNRRHAVSYSGTRTYDMRNFRFNKQARVVARMTYRPSEGKRFTITERSGSDKLIDIIEQLIDTEVQASRPGLSAKTGIAPENYDARLRGSATVNGRDCWVLDLKPRSKSKFLLSGTVWVDKLTHGLVRLDGVTAASLSIWVGAPHIVEDRTEVGGFWLPSRIHSRSSTWLTGDSDLEVNYTGYQIQR